MTLTTILLLIAIVLLILIVLMQVRALRQSRAPEIERIATELQNNTRYLRDETTRALGSVQSNLSQQIHQDRIEQRDTITQFGTSQQENLERLMRLNNEHLGLIQASLEKNLEQLQKTNAEKLDQMRQTVDEKLHETLERRLGQSFTQVSTQLEQVQRGLGEMRSLATGVGDLKRVLTNVKTRGTWGEVQLGNLLSEVMTPAQYAQNVETVAGSGERVEFAIRLPGKDDKSDGIWLPIDAKFPKEQYERLVQCAEVADAAGVSVATKELERAIRKQAQTISSKYVAPPATTDFALMFLPTEGLYAEVMRMPGLSDDIQRLYRVVIAGPSTFVALLNSLQMGFKTLAIEQRSTEVWQVLGSVKTEFIKFADTLDKIERTIKSISSNIEETQRRTRVMQRKLKNVQDLPTDKANKILDFEEEEKTLDEA